MGKPIQTRKESHGVSVCKYSPSGDLIWHRDSFHHARFEPLHTPEEAYSYLNYLYGNGDPALSGLPRNDINYVADITDEVNIDDVRGVDGINNLIDYGESSFNNDQYFYFLNSGIIPRALDTLTIDYNANRVAIINKVDDFISLQHSGVVYDRYGNTVTDGVSIERYKAEGFATEQNRVFLDNNASLYFVKPINSNENKYQYVDKLSLNREPKSRLFYRGYSTYNTIGAYSDYVYLHGKPLFRWDIIHNSGDGSFFEAKMKFYDSSIIGNSGGRFNLIPHFHANSGISFTIYPSSNIVEFSDQISSGWLGGNVTVSQVGNTFFDGIKFETTESGIYPFYLQVNPTQPISGITPINDFSFSRLNPNTLDIESEIQLGASGYSNIHLNNDNIYLYSKTHPYKKYVKLDSLGQIVNSGEYNYVGQDYGFTYQEVVDFTDVLAVDNEDSVYLGYRGLTKWNSDGVFIWHKGNWANNGVAKCRENMAVGGGQTAMYADSDYRYHYVSGDIGVNTSLTDAGSDLSNFSLPGGQGHPSFSTLEIRNLALDGFDNITAINPYQGNIVNDRLYMISQSPITTSGYIHFVLNEFVMNSSGNTEGEELGQLFQPYDNINTTTMSAWANSLLPTDASISWSGGPVHLNNLGMTATATTRRSTVSHTISRTAVFWYDYNEGSGVHGRRPPEITINGDTVTVDETSAGVVYSTDGTDGSDDGAENLQTDLVFSNAGSFTKVVAGEPVFSGLYWGYGWYITFDTPSYAQWDIAMNRYNPGTDPSVSSGVCASLLCFNKAGDVYWTKPYDIINPNRNSSVPGMNSLIGINDVDSDEDGNVYCAGKYLNKWRYWHLDLLNYKFNG